MLKNYNYIVQTVLLLALAIGTQGKANTALHSFIFDNSTAECAEDGSYSNRDELIEYLVFYKAVSAFDLEISCVKYWLDEENDRNIISISSLVPIRVSSEFEFHVDNHFGNIYRTSDEWEGENQTIQKEKIKFSPHAISKAGGIFPDSYGLSNSDVVSVSDFTSLIKTDRGLGRLVQLNLKRPIKQENSVCADHNPNWDPFYMGAIDGLWGRASGRALQKFVETCPSIDDEITASMITELLLPQLFSLSDDEPTIDSGPATSEQIEQNQTTSEDTANLDAESENPVTSILETITAAAKDVEGTPVEDPDAGLEHEKEISSLRDKLEEKEAEISRLNEVITNLKSSKNDELANLKNEISKKTIFQIWEDLEIKVKGMMPNGKWIYADTRRQDSYGCILSASEDVMKSAVEAYEKDSCYQHTFGDMEIDTSKPFSWDEGKREVIVYLLPKREKFIKSMKTAGIIDGLTEKSSKTCGIELSLLRDEELVEFEKEYTGLYSEWDGGAFLKDSGLESEKIAYEGISVLINTGKVEDQKCSLPSGIEMPISTGDYIPNGSPQALIDRNGHVTIYDLPISAVKGATLAVFFDTNVGIDDATNYAFNKSLTDKIWRETHRTYFSAFSEALKNYLKSQSKFENIIIYQSLSEEEARSVKTYSGSNFTTIFESEGIDNKISNDELNNALDEFAVEFNPGQKGSFHDKRKEIERLLDSSQPIEFVSFGPSGLDYSEVCNDRKSLRGSPSIAIFDVWPPDTLGELLDTEQLASRKQQLVNVCANNNKILGLKEGRGYDRDDISRDVLEYLNL
ncbi:hypothetical protein N8380_08915, partial [Planktomarina temperata]|nr:hypothetical protein [Planktomarina temperata]